MLCWYVYHDHHALLPQAVDFLSQPARGSHTLWPGSTFQGPPTEDEVLRTLQSFFAQRDLCSLLEDPCLWLLDPQEQSLWWRIQMSTCICSFGLRRQAFPQQPSEGPCVLLFTSKVWVLCARLSKDRFPKQLPPITRALEPDRPGC